MILHHIALGMMVWLLGTLYCADSNHQESSKPDWENMRKNMISQQIKARGMRDERVLEALDAVPRHEFVPETQQKNAYEDHPLPIGYDQTISQPYIVAYMTDALDLQSTSRVLEVGTGSGYQAAVLAVLVDSVYTIEIVQPLCASARKRLKRLQYDNVSVRCGDGYQGWPEKAPFDAIIVTAAAPHIPQPLIDQLAIGGRLIIPVGEYYQELMLYRKNAEGKLETKRLIAVRFVPLTGEAQE
jgi:protein-L-isoaspartate(D-aspartate) O-methyltransferase